MSFKCPTIGFFKCCRHHVRLHLEPKILESKKSIIEISKHIMTIFRHFPEFLSVCVFRVKKFYRPNVKERSYYSDLLDETITTTFTPKAMRQIDYIGGFDRYILLTSDKVLCSNFAGMTDNCVKVFDLLIGLDTKTNV